MHTLTIATLAIGASLTVLPSSAGAAVPLPMPMPMPMPMPDNCGAHPNDYSGVTPQGNATRTYTGTITGGGTTRHLAITFMQNHIVYNARIWTDDGSDDTQMWFYYILTSDVDGIGQIDIDLPPDILTTTTSVRCSAGSPTVTMLKGRAKHRTAHQKAKALTFKVFAPDVPQP